MRAKQEWRSPEGQRMVPAELVENGREVYGWRMRGGAPEFVVVEIGFIVPGLNGEEFERFKLRMLSCRRALERLGYAVVVLAFHRRRAQNRRHWAEFTCMTPAATLPLPARLPGL